MSERESNCVEVLAQVDDTWLFSHGVADVLDLTHQQVLRLL